MVARSAGVLLYRTTATGPEVLLVHPGGPLWARRDAGAWSIPKGEYDESEDPRAAALREFAEETGARPDPSATWLDLGTVTQKNGKRVRAWAVEGDLDVTALRSNTFTMEWPPRSGRTGEFPEVDRAEWFTPDAARERINPAQAALVDRLLALLGTGLDTGIDTGLGTEVDTGRLGAGGTGTSGTPDQGPGAAPDAEPDAGPEAGPDGEPAGG